GVGPSSIGPRPQMTSSASTSNVLLYDRLGRPTSSSQSTSGNTYGFTYAYDRAGNLTLRSYPSGRAGTTTWDRASRVASVQQTAPAAGAGPFVSGATNAPHGAPAERSLGGGPRHERTTSFNSRLQPTVMGLGTAAAGDLSFLRLQYG